MVFVLTNDDGIDAPGLQALANAVQQLGYPWMIVAPQEHLSGCGHQVTTTRVIQVQQRSESAYAIAGTPANCVRIALTHLCPQVQCVLSGINSGGNLGADVYISGTVAAVREAAFHRIPGVAFSHYRQGRREIDWEYATQLVMRVLPDLLAQPSKPVTFWNVNFPHLQLKAPEPEIVFCTPCTQPLPINYRIEGNGFYYVGEYSKRLRDPGSDVEVCFAGSVAVTQLHL